MLSFAGSRMLSFFGSSPSCLAVWGCWRRDPAYVFAVHNCCRGMLNRCILATQTPCTVEERMHVANEWLYDYIWLY